MGFNSAFKGLMGTTVLSHEVKRPGRTANHSPKSRAEHKNERSRISAVLHVSTACTMDNFTKGKILF